MKRRETPGEEIGRMIAERLGFYPVPRWQLVAIYGSLAALLGFGLWCVVSSVA